MKNLLIGLTGILISANVLASHQSTAVRCDGSGVTVIVSKQNILSVYDYGHLVLSDYARKEILENGPVVFRTAYSTGPVLQGGVNLRITTRHKKNPKVSGTAHLTVELDGAVNNLLMKCSKY